MFAWFGLCCEFVCTLYLCSLLFSRQWVVCHVASLLCFLRQNIQWKPSYCRNRGKPCKHYVSKFLKIMKKNTVCWGVDVLLTCKISSSKSNSFRRYENKLLSAFNTDKTTPSTFMYIFFLTSHIIWVWTSNFTC